MFVDGVHESPGVIIDVEMASDVEIKSYSTSEAARDAPE
jgi:hypothetical protein